MKFNTGNPIGSTDARDLSDNAENFDKALGTLDATWTDRFGVTRDSFEGRLAKGSFYRVGTFAAGYTLTNMRQTLEYDGHEYSWAGTFPKVVAAGATPAASGGIGAGAWVDRSDVTLRDTIGDVYLSDYCTGNGVDSDVAGFRAAISACREGCTVYGDSGATYYLDYQPDGRIVDVTKSINFDFRGAKFIYKTYDTVLTSGATHVPAIKITGHIEKTISLTGKISINSSSITMPDSSHGITPGTWLSISGSGYPTWTGVTTYGRVSELVYVDKVDGEVLRLNGLTRNYYQYNVKVVVLSLLNGVTVSNISSATEIDPGTLTTKALSGDCGHFLSIEYANYPKIHNVNVMGGHRMFAAWIGFCVSPSVINLSSKCKNDIYPPIGGMAYTLRYQGCFSPYSRGVIGFAVRHVIDYTSSNDAVQINNVGLGVRTAAFCTHGFLERNITSIGDACYQDSFNNPNGTNIASGWTFGNLTFGPSFGFKLLGFSYRGSGTSISITSKSKNITIDNADIIYSGTGTPVHFEDGCGDIKVIGGRLTIDNVDNTEPVIRAGAYLSEDLGYAAFTASAGVNPTVTIVATRDSSTAFNVGESVYLALNDTAESQYTGYATIASYNPATKTYTASYDDARTTTVALSFTASPAILGGRRVFRSTMFYDVSNITISDVKIEHYGIPTDGVINLNATGNVSITAELSSGGSADLIIIDSRNGRGSSDEIRITNCSDINSNTYDNFCRINYSIVKKGILISGCSLNKFSNYALSVYGTDDWKRSSVYRYGVIISDNNCSTVSAKGISNMHIWDELVNRYPIKVTGNIYPLAMTDATFGMNWESGVFSPVVSTATASATMTRSLGRYSLSGNTLSLSGRVSWSGLTGTLPMKISAPYVRFGSNNMPVVLSNVSLGALTGFPMFSYSTGYIYMEQFLSGSTSNIPVSASGDLCFTATVVM